MKNKIWAGLLAAACSTLAASAAGAPQLTVSPNETLEMQGLSVIVEQMHFHPVFRDEKNAGIQIILHDDRIATDGEVRLHADARTMGPGARLRETRARAASPIN